MRNHRLVVVFGDIGVQCMMADEQHVVVKYDYKAADERELDIRKNEKLMVLDRTGNWWKVQNQIGRSGYVPSNYLKTWKPSLFSSLKKIIRKPSRGEADSLPASYSSAYQNGGDGTLEGQLGEMTLCDTFTAIVRYAYDAQKSDELSLSRGDTVVVREKSSDGWWRGRSVTTGLFGWFPSNYVEVRTGDTVASNVSSPRLDDSGRRRRRPIAAVRQAVALFKFDATNDDELSFDENERLDILDCSAPSEAGWLRAQNARGSVGLIPQEFVRIVSTDDTESPPCGPVANTVSGGSLSNSSTGQGSLGAERSSSGISLSGASRNGSAPFAGREWYFGSITRADCEDMMNQHADNGDFLIRESETNVGDYTLTMKTPHRNKHFRIIVDSTGTYRIGPQLFHSLDDLVEHYMKHAIYRLGTEKLFLIKPFVRRKPPRDISDAVGSIGTSEVAEPPRDNAYDM